MTNGREVLFFATRSCRARVARSVLGLIASLCLCFAIFPDALGYLWWTLPVVTVLVLRIVASWSLLLLPGAFAIRVDDVGVASNLSVWMGRLYWNEIASVQITESTKWGPILEIFVVDRRNVLRRFDWDLRFGWKANRNDFAPNTPFSTILLDIDAPKESVLAAMEAGLADWRRRREQDSTRDGEGA